jgi:hypothetical protein
MDDVRIPAEFWKGISVDEFMEIARSGLSAEQCSKIWNMLGRTDEAPKSMDAVISRADLERLFPRKMR